jgi:hypothetical protein
MMHNIYMLKLFDEQVVQTALIVRVCLELVPVSKIPLYHTHLGTRKILISGGPSKSQFIKDRQLIHLNCNLIPTTLYSP